MTDDPPDALDTETMSGTCPDTLAAWLWACDEHQDHGTADSQDEAEQHADLHESWHEEHDAPDGCHTVVWQRTPHERTATP